MTFYLLWQGGLRLSELGDLLLADVDLQGGYVVVREGKGLKDRTVCLTETAVRAIGDYLAVRGSALTEHLFIYRHRPLSKDLVAGRSLSAGRRLGFRVTPHMLRHTFGTQLINAGCRVTTIQALLGHKGLTTTMIYARVHDATVARDYFAAMAVIEQGSVAADLQMEDPIQLLEIVAEQNLALEQREALEKLRVLLTSWANDGFVAASAR